MFRSKTNIISGLSAAVLAISMSGVQKADAFDPEATFKDNDGPRTILRYGFNALKKGNMEHAIGAFRFGAEKNSVAAEWKLANMLQAGAGLPQDHLAAYKLYRKIVLRSGEKPPRVDDWPYVSNALVALGKYCLTGIDGSVQANPRRAEDHFYRAAALYKNPEAQFQLGHMYRHGVLGVKQPRSAVRWLGLSARKGHQGAQAELGEMLFYGEGVARRPIRGLVFISRAAARTASNDIQSFRERRKRAFADASDAQRAEADKILSQLNLAPDSQ